MNKCPNSFESHVSTYQRNYWDRYRCSPVPVLLSMFPNRFKLFFENSNLELGMCLQPNSISKDKKSIKKTKLLTETTAMIRIFFFFSC